MTHGDSTEFCGIKIVSDAYVSDGVITVKQSTEDSMSRIARQMTAWSMNTLDAQVRAGLVALGWTPPRDNQPDEPGEG